MKKFILTCITLLTLSPAAFAATSAQSVYVDVNGLVCDFCARALEKVFSKQESVNTINVDLDSKVITIYFKPEQILDDATITELIEDSGYNVRGIRHEDQ